MDREFLCFLPAHIPFFYYALAFSLPLWCQNAISVFLIHTYLHAGIDEEWMELYTPLAHTHFYCLSSLLASYQPHYLRGESSNLLHVTSVPLPAPITSITARYGEYSAVFCSGWEWVSSYFPLVLPAIYLHWGAPTLHSTPTRWPRHSNHSWMNRPSPILILQNGNRDRHFLAYSFSHLLSLPLSLSLLSIHSLPLSIKKKADRKSLSMQRKENVMSEC